MTTTELTFPTLLQDFFLKRLVAQRGASAQTIASYRDTFELLLRFIEKQTRQTPSSLTIDDLDAGLAAVEAFVGPLLVPVAEAIVHRRPIGMRRAVCRSGAKRS